MSRSPKLPFSVAKFTIEGVGQGADQSHTACSAPPRLPGSHIASVPKTDCSFLFNPFSLSHSSFNNLHAHISPPHGPIVNVSNTVIPPASASFSSPSQHVSSLFPNPFLIKQNSDSQPVSLLISKTCTDSSWLPTSQTTAQSIQQSTSSSTSYPQATSNSVTLLHKTRKPRPDHTLTPSLFRPRVMAVDRLFSWHTPYGLSHDNSLLTELPSALVESAKMSITGALAISSRSTYAAGLLRFSQFCDRWQIPERTRMPASYALLCAFIGNYKGTVSGKTIKSWLSGIRAWHFINHAPWYGDDKWVQMARISANKEGSRHKCALRAPVSIEHLLALWRVVKLSDHFHAAIWAVALVTFFGCCRLGEIAVGSVSSFDPNLHVLRSAEYVDLLFSLSLYSFIFLESLSIIYETGHVPHLSAYPEQKLLVKRVPPLSSLPATMNSALVRLCATTSLSTTMCRALPPCLPTPLQTDNGST